MGALYLVTTVKRRTRQVLVVDRYCAKHWGERKDMGAWKSSREHEVTAREIASELPEAECDDCRAGEGAPM